MKDVIGKTLQVMCCLLEYSLTRFGTLWKAALGGKETLAFDHQSFLIA
jgi:hypothetical protein